MVALALALLLGFWAGSLGDGAGDQAAKGPASAQLARAQQAAAEEADERHQIGLREGRAEFRPGSAGYRRIYSTGVRAGRKQMAAKAKARYAAGVRDGKAAARENAELVRQEGWDEGYDIGFEDGYDDGYSTGLDEGADGYSGGGGGEVLPDVGYDLDCEDFDGPVDVSAGDPHGLDADGDGVGCE